MTKEGYIEELQDCVEGLLAELAAERKLRTEFELFIAEYEQWFETMATKADNAIVSERAIERIATLSQVAYHYNEIKSCHLPSKNTAK